MDTNPLGVGDSRRKPCSQAWCLRSGKAVERRDSDEGCVEVPCVHTMAPDPEQCPQLRWEGRTLSPGLGAM